jgi:two-component system chemotaxis sensor kinase CheA
MVDILLEEAKKVLMLPFSSALEVLPKMARDLSRAQGKEVEFVLQGGDIEVDKRILEEIKDPLIHILRNCIDHGIESPAERERRQKPRCGSIVVAISPGDGNSVEIVVQDNGAGIDAEKVRDAAVKSGIISCEVAEQLSDQEAIGLIFQSEVSTSETVSDISGRGLGMAIVREKVEKLGGHIAVETHLHHGTTFRIVLPLTLATFRGVLVQSAGQTFIVPTASVERVIRIHRDAIHSTGNTETVSMAGHTLPLLRLERVLGLATKKRDEERGPMQLALVVGQGEQQVAFGLDAVLNEQEVLFKGLGPQLVRVRNIAGATILGSGQVAPVLNVNDLLTAVNGAAPSFSVVTEETVEEGLQKKSILVAEDSITSRMLLKEILESAGYVVSTAIDGEDAFSALQKAQFDLVVSDVEMPRMNGFDLASKIRDDERYAHLPVVLVTGLESQTDRERGINAGANAYVVKGSFDQSNLLETIRQFL